MTEKVIDIETIATPKTHDKIWWGVVGTEFWIIHYSDFDPNITISRCPLGILMLAKDYGYID